VIFMIHPTKIMHLDHGIHDSHSRFVALAEPPTQDVNCILLLLILLLPFEDNIFFSALSADFPVLNNNKSDLHFPQCCALDISLQSLAESPSWGVWDVIAKLPLTLYSKLFGPCFDKRLYRRIDRRSLLTAGLGAISQKHPKSSMNATLASDLLEILSELDFGWFLNSKGSQTDDICSYCLVYNKCTMIAISL